MWVKENYRTNEQKYNRKKERNVKIIERYSVLFVFSFLLYIQTTEYKLSFVFWLFFLTFFFFPPIKSVTKRRSTSFRIRFSDACSNIIFRHLFELFETTFHHNLCVSHVSTYFVGRNSFLSFIFFLLLFPLLSDTHYIDRALNGNSVS